MDGNNVGHKDKDKLENNSPIIGEKLKNDKESITTPIAETSDSPLVEQSLQTLPKITVIKSYPHLFFDIELDQDGKYWAVCTNDDPIKGKCTTKTEWDSEEGARRSGKGHYNKHRPPKPVQAPPPQTEDQSNSEDDGTILKGPEADEQDRRERLVLALENAPLPSSKKKSIVDYILNEWDHDRQLRNNSTYFKSVINGIQGMNTMIADRIEIRTFFPEQEQQNQYPYGQAPPRPNQFGGMQQYPQQYPPQQPPQILGYDAYNNPIYAPPQQYQLPQQQQKGMTKAEVDKLLADKEKELENKHEKEEYKKALEKATAKIDDIEKNPDKFLGNKGKQDPEQVREITELKAIVNSLKDKLGDTSKKEMRDEYEKRFQDMDKRDKDRDRRDMDRKLSDIGRKVDNSSTRSNRMSDEMIWGIKSFDKKTDFAIETMKETMKTAREGMRLSDVPSKKAKGKGKALIDPDEIKIDDVEEEDVI